VESEVIKQIRTITAVGPKGLQSLSIEQLQTMGSALTQLIVLAEACGNSPLLDDYCQAKRDLNKELGRRCKIA
jgi:hypothetical protein